MNNEEKQEEMKKEANELIDALQYALEDLGYWSVRHDDYFNYETNEIDEALRSCRKQLIGDPGIIDTQH
jgi:hypothetical protein